MELTIKQKKIVIDYIMYAGKGIYEDVPEFWEGMTQDEVDEKYPELKDATDDFVELCKQKLLASLDPA